MRRPTKLIEDGSGRQKLEVSLPGGRYHLSLHANAINLLCDDLGFEVGDSVPDPFVRILVATRDAWFPKQRDSESVVDELPADGTLTPPQREALINFLRSIAVSPRDADLVKRVVSESPVNDVIDPEEVSVKSLPLADSELLPQETEADEAEREPFEVDAKKQAEDLLAEVQDGERKEPDLFGDELGKITEIPGIGPKRGSSLVEAGYHTPEEIADERPADIARVTGLGEQMATVAVEGAREITGYKTSTATRLAQETDVSPELFESALAPLAASGIPPSEAAPVLRVLYGPTVADIPSVSGQQAYFLWEEGYRTPKDIVDADRAELSNVYSLGDKTSKQIVADAEKLIGDS